MTHIAIQESLNGSPVTWMEQVADERLQFSPTLESGAPHADYIRVLRQSRRYPQSSLSSWDSRSPCDRKGMQLSPAVGSAIPDESLTTVYGSGRKAIRVEHRSDRVSLGLGGVLRG